MKIPKMRETIGTVAEMVRHLMPTKRFSMSRDERALAVHLRGNQQLLNALKGLIEARIEGRVKLPEPSDPLVAKSMIARDRELPGLLARLEFIFHSPADNPVDEREQPE